MVVKFKATKKLFRIDSTITFLLGARARSHLHIYRLLRHVAEQKRVTQ